MIDNDGLQDHEKEVLEFCSSIWGNHFRFVGYFIRVVFHLAGPENQRLMLEAIAINGDSVEFCHMKSDRCSTLPYFTKFSYIIWPYSKY